MKYRIQVYQLGNCRKHILLYNFLNKIVSLWLLWLHRDARVIPC